jgi:hypothetical protein
MWFHLGCSPSFPGVPEVVDEIRPEVPEPFLKYLPISMERGGPVGFFRLVSLDYFEAWEGHKVGAILHALVEANLLLRAHMFVFHLAPPMKLKAGCTSNRCDHYHARVYIRNMPCLGGHDRSMRSPIHSFFDAQPANQSQYVPRLSNKAEKRLEGQRTPPKPSFPFPFFNTS